MHKICLLPYGKGEIPLYFPENIINYDIFYPPAANKKAYSADDVRQLLNDYPFKITPQSKISIAINDKTRPLRYDVLLIPLLLYLKERGILDRAITLYVATGTHAPFLQKELHDFIPYEVTRRYEIICHDCDANEQLSYLGKTKMGTPIWINKKFLSADTKIALGNIEPHHFMGFSGGIKTVAIGLGGRATIEANHHLLLQPFTIAGEYERNPMRQDIEAIGDFNSDVLCLNSVMNYKKDVLQVFLGSPREVMQKGIPESQSLTQVKIPPVYDLVIASAGGYPKDINLYQAQKALSNACMICKDGGSIILVAECREGNGNQKYANFMQNKINFQQVLDEFEQIPFQIGPHKAYLIARQGLHHHLYLLSCMPDEVVQQYLFSPLHSFTDIFSQLDLSGMRIAILPYATTTIPFV